MFAGEPIFVLYEYMRSHWRGIDMPTQGICPPRAASREGNMGASSPVRLGIGTALVPAAMESGKLAHE